jgi:hypothetical protein
MLDEKLLGQKVQALLLDLCAVLHNHGYREISVGVLMRIAGVPDDRARLHDTEFFEITEAIHQPNPRLKSISVPPGATLH